MLKAFKVQLLKVGKHNLRDQESDFCPGLKAVKVNVIILLNIGIKSQVSIVQSHIKVHPRIGGCWSKEISIFLCSNSVQQC